jgi:hypothetical protein
MGLGLASGWNRLSTIPKDSLFLAIVLGKNMLIKNYLQKYI